MPDGDDNQNTDDTPGATALPGQHIEPVEDEEKILAGRHDVNLPALLTKDVQGG